MSRRDWTDKELFQRLLTNKTTKTYWDNVRELHLRVNKYVFNKSVKLASSNIPKERIIGIDVLAQLGIEFIPLLKKESILAKKDPHINLEWKQDLEELIEYLEKKKEKNFMER